MEKEPIYARAKPSSVNLNESYFYEKKISRNPFTRQYQIPSGKVEITLPYDGYQYFTRQAYNDVKVQLDKGMPHDNLEAQIGYLSFINYDRTNLRGLLALNERYGSFPLCVSVIGEGITSIEQLNNDTLKNTITWDYTPNWPDTPPVDIVLELWDEDTLKWPGTGTTEEDDEQLGAVAEQITQQVNFLRNLLIRSRIHINIPSQIIQKDVQPSTLPNW